MIKVKLYKNYERKSPEKIVFKMSGHAGAAPAGEDLICAAATAYMWQLVEAVKGAYKQGWLLKKPRININGIYISHYVTNNDVLPSEVLERIAQAPEDAKTRITICPKAEYVKTVNLLATMTATGFDWLAKQFPEYVKLN